MIMGDVCTRACSFCNVKTGKPTSLDQLEPLKVARATKELNLKHVVITSVDRDDLNDGGADHFSKVIIETRKMNKNIENYIINKQNNNKKYRKLNEHIEN